MLCQKVLTMGWGKINNHDRGAIASILLYVWLKHLDNKECMMRVKVYQSFFRNE